MNTPEVQIQPATVESAEKLLAGKVFLLTGASRGIGAVTALELAKRGATVIEPHRDPGKESRANEVVKEAERAGGKMIAIVADVTKPEDRAKLLQITNQQFGKIDGIIFNHAGGLEKGADLDYSLEVNGHAKLALFEEARRSGVLKDMALVIDIPSLWSKFYFTGVKQMDVYEPVAKGKKLGEQLLREAIRPYDNIKFGAVCGQGVGGTITMRLLDRLYPKEVAEIKQAAEGGKLPEIVDMARAVADMAQGDFEDEEVVFVGVPQVKEDEMPQILSMYNGETRYVDRLVRFDARRSFGFYRVKDKDARTHFNIFAGPLLHNGRGTAVLDASEEHMLGHFVPEFGISVLPGHKITAAAIETALVNLEDTSEDVTNPRLTRIDGPAEFKIPVLPKDRLRFQVEQSDVLVMIGETKVAKVSGLRFESRDMEEPNGMTSDRFLETAAQTLGVAYLHEKDIRDVLPLLGGIKGPVEYQREVFPGELLEMEAVLTGEEKNQFNGDVTFRVDDEIVAKVSGIDCRLFPRQGLGRLIRMGRRALK